MNRDRLRDSLSVYMGVLPKELRERVPPQCRRCPTLLALADFALMSEGWSNSAANKAMCELDRSEQSEKHPGVAARHRDTARGLTDQSERLLSERDGERATIDKLVPATDNCPGAVVGDLTLLNGAELLLSKIAGMYWGFGPRERSCPNSAFGDMQSDPGVKSALKFGNWVGGLIER